jgi:neutral ceramidase
MSILRVGVARRVINPPPGIYLMGYGNRIQGNLGIHDDLFVTTLVLEDDSNRAALLTVDHTFINAVITERIKSRIFNTTGIASNAVFICCSHTHAAPIGYADAHSRSEDQAYIDLLIDRLTESVVEAAQNAQPATLKTGMDEAHININRRERTPDGSIIIGNNPAGLIDHSLQVLQVINMDNQPVATLVNYACHPVVMGPLNRYVSADWVGAMRKHVEAQLPGLCLFIQGTTADINPRKMRWEVDSWDEVEEQGQNVAEAVLRACNTLTPINSLGLRAQQSTEWLKLLPPRNYPDQIRAFLPPGLSNDQIREAIRHDFPWHTALDERPDGMYSPMSIGVLRVGGWALATIETEPFVETGLKIKSASPISTTFVAGYTNGCNSYLPVESAYAEGGYEVETAPLFYGLPAPFVPGSAEQITGTIIELLNHSAE